MKTIPLSRGLHTVVSDVDFVFLNQWKWWCCGKGQYAIRSRRSTDPLTPAVIRMHRVIADRMGLPQETIVDHRNRDGLRNCRSNLRSATNVTNGRNRRRNKNNTSGFKGVSKDGYKWRAVITVQGRKVWLGQFSTKELAAVAYDKAAKRYFGRFAYLNFPTKRVA
jgi:hypothetical protein